MLSLNFPTQPGVKRDLPYGDAHETTTTTEQGRVQCLYRIPALFLAHLSKHIVAESDVRVLPIEVV